MHILDVVLIIKDSSKKTNHGLSIQNDTIARLQLRVEVWDL